MTQPTGRPEFFVLEAGEYLERIALLARQPIPDRDNLLRFARALQSSALMAGPPGFAVLAGALEDLARRYATEGFPWSSDLGLLVSGAVEQGRELLRRVRQWSTEEIARCRQVAEPLLEAAPVVPIETLAPEPEAAVVPIEALAPDRDGDIVPIESLLYAEPAPGPRLSPFEQTFSTYYRLLRGRTPEEEPVPIRQLLYRGRRALERAELVRRELAAHRRERASARTVETLLDELLDLVPLALDAD